MTQADLPLLGVCFEHPRPANIDEHRWVFGCEVSFDAPEHKVTFHRDALALPVVKADPKLGALIDQYAEELLQRLPRGHALSDRVRQIVAESLCDGDHGLEPIAERLRMSPRTLQRRLQEEDTSHQQLVDELRHELAVKYLAEPNLSIGEVAFLLGFSDPSAFHRAFRRWTGKTPGEHRRPEKQRD
jgi:AraC-like DNA-binding protein